MAQVLGKCNRRIWVANINGSKRSIAPRVMGKTKCVDRFQVSKRDLAQQNNDITNMKSLGLYLLKEGWDDRLELETTKMSHHHTDVTICLENDRTNTQPRMGVLP